MEHVREEHIILYENDTPKIMPSVTTAIQEAKAYLQNDYNYKVVNVFKLMAIIRKKEIIEIEYIKDT